MLIEHRPIQDPELSTLVVAQQRELRAADGGLDGAFFLVAVVAGRAVACGAWQPLEPGVAELKRMYVRPAFRRRGIAGQLVVALEEEALAADRPVIRLAAGPYLPAAVALFRSSGYQAIPGHGFERRLAVLVQ